MTLKVLSVCANGLESLEGLEGLNLHVSTPPLLSVRVWSGRRDKSISELMGAPEAYRPSFSIYQSGVDFKCPYSTRPLKPLTRLIGLVVT